MKKLLFVLLFFVIITAGIPALFIGLMYDGKTVGDMPIELYAQHDEIDPMDLLYQQLDAAFKDVRAADDADFAYDLHQDVLNLIIFDTIRENNLNYMPIEGCAPEACYISSERIEMGNNTIHLRLIGMWISFEDDRFSGNIAVEFQYNDGFTYKSSIKSDFSFVDDLDDGEYRLAFERFKIGNFPLPRFIFSALLGLVENVADDVRFEDIEEDVPLGDLSIRGLSYTLPKDDIAEYIREESDGDEMMQLLAEVVQGIYDEDIIVFKLSEHVFTITLGVSKIRVSQDTDIPLYLYDMHDQDGFNPDLFDFEKHLRTRFEHYVFNMALNDQNYLTIQEMTFNKMIYHSADGFKETQFIFDYTDTEGNEEELRFGLLAVWIEFIEENGDLTIEMKALFDLAGIRSLMVMRLDEVDDYDQGEYAFDLTSIILGDSTNEDYLEFTELAPFRNFLKELDDFGFGHVSEEGYIVIDTEKLTDTLDDGTQEGAIEVGPVEIVHGGIRVHITVDEDLQAAFDAFNDAMNDLFAEGDLLDELAGWETAGGAQEDAYNAISDIQSGLDAEDPEAVEEAINDLIEAMEQLDQAAQDELWDAIQDSIDPGTWQEFEDNFGN